MRCRCLQNMSMRSKDKMFFETTKNNYTLKQLGRNTTQMESSISFNKLRSDLEQLMIKYYPERVLNCKRTKNDRERKEQQ